MPALKIYALFISHAWRHNADYYRLVELLKAAPNFERRNYSVPEHDPLIDPDQPAGRVRLTEELKGQIRPVNCVIIISGMYVAYSYWIQKEIDLALSYSKPILGIRPWGQERVPEAVSSVANEMVGWNTDTIVAAIRRISL